MHRLHVFRHAIQKALLNPAAPVRFKNPSPNQMKKCPWVSCWRRHIAFAELRAMCKWIIHIKSKILKTVSREPAFFHLRTMCATSLSRPPGSGLAAGRRRRGCPGDIPFSSRLVREAHWICCQPTRGFALRVGGAWAFLLLRAARVLFISARTKSPAGAALCSVRRRSGLAR
jgi:hypothetical protein